MSKKKYMKPSDAWIAEGKLRLYDPQQKVWRWFMPVEIIALKDLQGHLGLTPEGASDVLACANWLYRKARKKDAKL